MKIRVHKIASVTANLDLGHEVEIGEACEARAGNVIVVEALQEKRVYDQLELVTGRMAKISKGDIIVSALGARRALKGFMGDVPAEVAVGDTLQVLNLGGVIGVASREERIDIGRPLDVKVLGMVVRDGRILNIGDDAVPSADTLRDPRPIIMVSGTCMHAGKTLACCEIIGQLAQRGYRLGGVKLTGVACLRDPFNMIDHGAVDALSFLDAGYPSTVGVPALDRVAKGLLNRLVERHPDIDGVVVELGDGIIGRYNVPTILGDAELMGATRCHVLCATDLVAAWGAVSVMSAYGITIDVMAGPATDNEVGSAYIEQTLKIRAANAHREPRKLAEYVEGIVFGKASVPGAGA